MAELQPNKKTSEEAAAGTLLDTDLIRITQGLGTTLAPWVSAKATLAALKAYFATGSGGGTGIVQSLVAGAGITVNSTDPAHPIVSVTPVTAYRWFRIYMVANGGGDVYTALGEVELRATVGGADLTTTATPAYANSTFTTYLPAKAVDNVMNSPTNSWINNGDGFPTWFALDMGTAVSVAQLAIAPQFNESGTSRTNRAPSAFAFQGSNTATNDPRLITDWATIGTFSGVTGYVDNTLKTFNMP